MRRLILTVFTLLAIPHAGWAQDPVKDSPPPPVLPTLGIDPADARPLRQTQNDRTINIIDGMMLHLNNGQIIELPAVWIPQGQGYESADQQVAAKQFVDSLFAKDSDHNIILYQTPTTGKGRINRLGHELAHVVRKNGNVWLQGALIANGYAQAWPTPSNPELADKMYALEDDARAAGKGLWAKDSPYRLFQADEPIDRLDRFAVVEGTVQSIATMNNVTYLNFGDDWKRDFTIGIQSPVRQSLARNRIDVMKLQGQRLRVRGWIRFYNGPFIDLEDPVQLQTLDQKQVNNTVPGAPQLSITDHQVREEKKVINAVPQQEGNNDAP